VSLHNIPAELKSLRQWMCWREENGNGKPTKVPYSPTSNRRASTTDPGSWATFNEALAAYEGGRGYSGAGLVFTDSDPYLGVDLDNCINESGELTPSASAIVKHLDSYTEKSVSGRGVHVILRAKKPGERCRKAMGGGGDVELYDTARYFCMTGDVIEQRSTIEDRQKELESLYDSLFKEPEKPPEKPLTVPTGLAVDEALQRAFAAANGEKVRRLYEGDYSDYTSPSEADLALCCHLAFWLGRDPQSIDTAFRRSGLYRPKWDGERGEQTYGQRTIQKAIEATTEIYSPRRPAALPSRTQGADRPGAWAGVGEMTLCNYDDVAKQILGIRQKKPRNDFETNTEVAEVVLNDLQHRGTFYHDGVAAYLFLEEEDKRLVEIDGLNDEYKLVLDSYGINATETIYRFVTEHLRVKALKGGNRTEAHRFCYYRPETFTLYLSNGSQVIRIAPEAIDLVDNGTDGVLFLHDRKYEPFELGEYDPSVSWLDEVIISKINFVNGRLTADEQRSIFTLSFYSLFFESIMPTKPIPALIGEKGSGKSSTYRMVGKLLFGPSFDVMKLPKDSKDFDVAVANSYFLAVDNVDSPPRWFEDRLATVATGGTLKVRKLYTDSTMVEIPSRCFLAVNSRTPQFRREDVADRLLVMKVARFDSFRAERELLDEVVESRNRVMSELIHHLQEIVQALKAEAGNNYSGTFRMADFADFAMKVGRQMGVEEALDSVLEKLSCEQTAFALGVDPFIKLLRLWIANGNAGQQVTSGILHQELSNLAEVEEVDFPYENAWSIGQLLREDRRSMLEQFFDVKHDDKGGRKRLYSFCLKS